MFESKDRAADPRFGVNVPCSGDCPTEPAKRFRFAITWTSLTAQLALRKADERTSATALQPVREISLTAPAGMAVTPLSGPETRSDSNARWEMVVPKMVRPDPGSKALVPAPITGYRNGATYSPMSLPTLTHLENARSPLLSRAFAVIERRAKALLAGPSKPTDAISGRSSRLQVLPLNGASFRIPSETQIARIEDFQVA